MGLGNLWSERRSLWIEGSLGFGVRKVSVGTWGAWGAKEAWGALREWGDSRNLGEARVQGERGGV